MATAKLSAIFAEVKGKIGNAVCVRARYGTVIRPRTIPNDPQTPKQSARRLALQKTAQAWKQLSVEQIIAWTNYANSITISTDLSGVKRSPIPYNAFSALATKLLQINANAQIPNYPPPAEYDGDDIQIEAEISLNNLQVAPSASNSQNTTTEILIQPLPSRARKPQPTKYRSLAFIHFTTNEPVSIPLPQNQSPPAYAIAYRFANIQTGQQTQLTLLPTLIVS